MSVKYICDVCQGEKQEKQLSSVEITEYAAEMPQHFQVCKECSEKMFKPVKLWNWAVVIEIKHSRI